MLRFPQLVNYFYRYKHSAKKTFFCLYLWKHSKYLWQKKNRLFSTAKKIQRIILKYSAHGNTILKTLILKFLKTNWWFLRVLVAAANHRWHLIQFIMKDNAATWKVF